MAALRLIRPACHFLTARAEKPTWVKCRQREAADLTLKPLSADDQTAAGDAGVNFDWMLSQLLSVGWDSTVHLLLGFRYNKPSEICVFTLFAMLLITHGMLFTWHTIPLIQPGTSSLCRFVCQTELDWKPRPTGTNQHCAGKGLDYTVITVSFRPGKGSHTRLATCCTVSSH